MDWSDYVNPFTSLGNAAASVVADGWTAAMLGLWNAGLWLLQLVLSIEDAFLDPDLRADGPMAGMYQATFWIAGALVLVLLMVQLGIAAVRRDGQTLGRALLGAAQFGAVWVTWVVYAVAVLAAAGGLTRALSGVAAGGGRDVGVAAVDRVLHRRPHRRHGRDRPRGDGDVPGLRRGRAPAGHARPRRGADGARGDQPDRRGGLVWDGGRAWFWKAFRWFLAAAFTPVLMA